VKRLIHTSSSAVVFDGLHGLFNANESLPYPDKVGSDEMILMKKNYACYIFIMHITNLDIDDSSIGPTLAVLITSTASLLFL
jgi:hypothetical protein